MSFVPQAATTWGLGDFDLPELSFNGTDDAGVQWLVEKVEGWDTTDAELPLDASPGDGGWFGPGRRPSKVLTLTGAFRASCRADADAAESRFRVAAAVTDRTQVLWQDRGGRARQMQVRQSGPCIVDPVPGQPRVRRFSVVLTAADPYRYAAGAAGLVTVELLPQSTTGGGLVFPLAFPMDLAGATNRSWATVDNPGDTPVHPDLRVEGPLRTGVRVEQVTTAEFFGITGDLPGGVAATSQFRYSNLLIDQVSARGRREPGSTYWQVQPGRNTFHLVLDPANAASDLSAATRAVLTYRPRWR